MTLVDPDIFLPHNLARQQLTGHALGYSKAQTLAHDLNTLFEESIAVPKVIDVLTSGGHEHLIEEYQKSQVILEMSASVPVARYLANDVSSLVRRLSLFLNPDGTDLVLLVEDSARKHRLDDLEMQYYVELTRSPELSEHLFKQGKPIRYGNRVATSQLKFLKIW